MQRRTKASIKRFEYYCELLLGKNNYSYAGNLLAHAAKEFRKRPALITDQEIISFEELFARAVAVTIKLKSMGVKPGDRVCVAFENSIEFYVSYYGAWQVGAVVIPLNTFLHEKEIQHILDDAQPVVVIASDQLAQKIQLISNHLPPLITGTQLSGLTRATQDELVNLTVPNRAPEDMAALLYTSGTTGVPKGVMLSSRCILTNIAQGMACIDATEKDRILGVLPLFHSFAQLACVWGNFFVGAAVIIVPKIDRKFIVHGLHHQPTIVLGVPALYGLFCLMRSIKFDSVRYFVSGGDAMPDKIRMAFELIFRRRICNGYGMTETSPLIAINFDDELCAPNTVGVPAPGLACSIRGDNNQEVSFGAKGILWVKGDNVMKGYYKDEQQTQAVLQDGWLNTGDCAYFDAKNRLVIFGRERDIIKNKGLIIYPQEIENVLLGHTAVIKVAVVGKKDESVGEIPVAFVALREPVTTIEQQLKMLCTQHLAPYKIPRVFFVLDDLPMTPLGKVDKKKLRAQLANHSVKDNS
ncbi:MAG: Long-chain-fatty-acid--CoA ligase [Candidatus Dependentiae bacterium ADurb.Bin331]|nr:MAG: Long-chain-fatty-acid--CoA ligase [Candidatus Dependentiae bacterium ADurb.Bin331]